MKKLKEALIQANLPFLLLLSYVITCIYRIPTLPEAIIVVGLSALFGFKLWLDFNTKQNPGEELEERVKTIENAVGGLALSAATKKAKTPANNFGWHKNG